MNRNDKILIIVLLIISIFSLGLQKWIEEPGKQILVTVNGKKYGQYSLDENQRIIIHSAKENENIIVIKDHSAYMEEASCQDLVCVHQRKVGKTGETIVCLPNKVVVEVIGGQDEEVDIITG
ncbi:NusG domain II-containing protein [Velocimicrobium porci]|uniref:NusG domain II-containing protein n=1 Tax=Velocimicrobium porci TaxID=2606634 RepID=A0A6L5XW56_9FIRM|nr:NusG domain II-containing protein [Velocimicrobium porci]MSS62839.1 NusG domain II-containing protein [Velocimicrobium porci]